MQTGPANGRKHGDHHSHGGERAMNAVLWCLAGITIVLGFFQTPLQEFSGPRAGGGAGAAVHHGWLPVAACLLAAVAIGQAWFEFGRKKANQIGWVERIPLLADLFGQRWYLDRLYRYLLDTLVYRGVAAVYGQRPAGDRRHR
jgi:NADH-quinone oxidoreductase subunit L